MGGESVYIKVGACFTRLCAEENAIDLILWILMKQNSYSSHRATFHLHFCVIATTMLLCCHFGVLLGTLVQVTKPVVISAASTVM